VAGIYIHIPFCKHACHYCNFHYSTTLTLQNDFTTALLKEIDLSLSYLGGDPIDTIYFGGGTPSLLAASSLQALLHKLIESFNISPNPEITLEANPDDINENVLNTWRNAGFNRLSIGIQSFFDEDLIWMNRAHLGEDAISSVKRSQDAGFENISIDLIYGSPGLTDLKWEENLDKAISLSPTHLSCYALTVEPKTALYHMIRAKKSADIIPETQARQFLTGIRKLKGSGFEHYEISSFALPGKRSRHNSAYWQSKKYLGLGPSAHSFNGVSRQWNISNNALYIESLKKNCRNFDIEILNPNNILNEYIMTSLRTSDGLSLGVVSDRFGQEKKRLLETHAAIYIEDKKIRQKEDRLVLTEEGLLFADGIASGLFFE
jgi:oxygen-independent coproporphyrinogen III oxidase